MAIRLLLKTPKIIKRPSRRVTEIELFQWQLYLVESGLLCISPYFKAR